MDYTKKEIDMKTFLYCKECGFYCSSNKEDVRLKAKELCRDGLKKTFGYTLGCTLKFSNDPQDSTSLVEITVEDLLEVVE